MQHAMVYIAAWWEVWRVMKRLHRWTMGGVVSDETVTSLDDG
jgi:hypothetical protein